MIHHKNLVLIGMPGAGKSTVGVLAAKALGLSYIDTDIVIQQKEKRLLQEIIDTDGIQRFLQIEEATITGVHVESSVIATGGSVIYSKKSMCHLKDNGLIVYLELPYEELVQRIKNMAVRGIVIGQGQKLIDVFNERITLYEAFAEVKINCSHQFVEDVVKSVCKVYHQVNGI